MKRNVFILLCIISNFLNAQTEKGRISIGGYFSGDYSELSSTKYQNSSGYRYGFNISPGVSVFIKNNLSLSPNISIGYSEYNDDYSNISSPNSAYNSQSTINTNSSYGIGVGVIKYIPSFERAFFTIGSNISYSHTIYKLTRMSSNFYSNYGADINKRFDNSYANNIILNLNIGMVYFVSKKIQLSAGFAGLGANYYFSNNHDSEFNYSSYNGSSYSTDNYYNYTSNGFNTYFRLTSSFYLGFNYFLK